jgi:hypothetical protein
MEMTQQLADLCHKASYEHDSRKLLALTEQINKLECSKQSDAFSAVQRIRRLLFKGNL